MPLTGTLRDLSARVSNWGRWGADDERGTLEPHRPRAAVRRGVARGAQRAGVLARDPVRRRRPAVGQRQHAAAHEPAAQLVRGERELHRRHRPTSPPATTRSRWARRPRPTGTRSRTSATRASSTTTSTTSVVTAEAGATRLGVEHIGPVVTRGVLLDIARLHGVDHFDDNYAITADDLDRAAAGARCERRSPATRVLVRTGQMHLLEQGSGSATRCPSPGLCRRHDRVGARPRRRRRRRPTRSRSRSTRARTRPSSCPCTCCTCATSACCKGQVWNLDDARGRLRARRPVRLPALRDAVAADPRGGCTGGADGGEVARVRCAGEWAGARGSTPSRCRLDRHGHRQRRARWSRRPSCSSAVAARSAATRAAARRTPRDPSRRRSSSPSARRARRSSGCRCPRAPARRCSRAARARPCSRRTPASSGGGAR